MMITGNQTKIKTVLTPAALVTMVILGLTATATQAAIVIYEPFDYPPGDIDGTQTGGKGFSSATGWTTAAFTRNPYDVLGTGLSFPGLPTEGRAVQRPSAPDNAEMHREISAASQTALTADNSMIWFSVLLTDNEYAGRYANAALVLGTGEFTDPGDKPATMAGGSAIGLSMNGQGDNTHRLHAITISGGTSSLSTGYISFPGDNESGGVTFLIAGKIDWAANGSDDTINLYNISDPTAPLPATFATMTADLDQSAFDTIAIADQQITPFDEIRFGTTFTDVMGIADPNAPDVDAGVDMITLSGMNVILTPTVVNNDTEDPNRPLSHTWTTDAPGGYTVEWNPSNTVEAPTVTITPDTPGNPQTVTLTLKVDLVGTSATASDTMEIDVYDDACLAAQVVSSPSEPFDPSDFDKNCITDLRDYAILAAEWLVDYALTAPIPKP